MVAEHGDRVVGFIVYELGKKSLRILNLAVIPSRQGRGVGRKLVRHLIDKLSPNRRRQLIAFVRDGNLDAHLFFKAVGCRACGVIDDFFDNGETAYQFRYVVQ